MRGLLSVIRDKKDLDKWLGEYKHWNFKLFKESKGIGSKCSHCTQSEKERKELFDIVKHSLENYSSLVRIVTELLVEYKKGSKK